METSHEACSQARERREIDGWYADILYALSCSPDISGKSPTDDELGYAQAGLGVFAISDPVKKNCSYALGAYMPYRITKECVDEVRIVQEGTARLGFPMIETSTAYLNDSPTPLKSITREVTGLADSELDPVLFAEPTGFRKVKYGKLFR